MAKFAAISHDGCRILIGLLTASAILIDPARAACGDEARVTCHAAFETITAVARSGDGFTAAGQTKGNPPGVALLRLTRTGEARGNPLFLRPPPNLAPERSIVTEPRKLIPLPNGDVVLLAQIAITEPAVRQIAWAARIAPNDRVVWSRAYPDNSASTIFHSGHYEPRGDRLILVGRRTSGGDPSGRCEYWSQSIVIPVAAATGQPDAPTAFGSQAKSLTNRQAIYDIAPDNRAGSYIVTGFLTAKHGDNEGTCQDNIMVGTLAQAGNRWTLSQVQSIGSNTANEWAFAIWAAGEGRYLLAGQGHDQATGAPAAQAYRVRVRPFLVETLLSTPYPPDGSDKSGGDRYRVIVPLAEKGRFMLAGSVSASKSAPNRAMWQIVSADLKTNGSPTVLNSPGSSDILEAITTQDGRVFAAGKWADEGRFVGWTGFIGDPRLADTGPPVRRRPVDSRLPRLSALPAANDTIELPAAAFSSGASYFERDLKAGSQYDLAFSIAASRAVKVSAYAESGDVDLVIVDANKQPVAFTNFKQSATELLFATLAPGKYTLSVIVQSAVPALELRISPFQDVSAKTLSTLAQLSDQQRALFADALELGGYTPPSNPSIALGGELVRAFLAIQEGAQREIAPSEIAKYIVPERQSRAR